MTGIRKNWLLFLLCFCLSFTGCKKEENPIQGELLLEATREYIVANGIATIDIKLYDELPDRTKTLINGELLLNGQPFDNGSFFRFSTEEARDHVFTARVGNVEEELIIHARAPQNYDTLYVPIIFHLIKDQRGTWARQSLETEGWLQELLDEANVKLNPDNEKLQSTFDNYNWHTANIKLVAATHDQAGNELAIHGLNIYEDTSRELILSRDADWRWDIYWNPSDYMNAWVGDIEYAGAGGLGYTPYFPTGTSPLPGTLSIPEAQRPNYITGIELEYITPDILLHELGHYLALHHVFTSRCNGPGDHCDDTLDYFKNDRLIPETTDRFSCTNREFLSNNIMDYTRRSTLFTYDQVARMRYSLEYASYRPFNRTSTGGEANLSNGRGSARMTRPEKVIHAHSEY